MVADEYWFDLDALLPGQPAFISTGLIPLAATFIGLGLIYALTRIFFKANHSEGLAGLITFILVSLVVLTIIGIYFRGINMALVLPF